jgi:hypothetical protein
MTPTPKSTLTALLHEAFEQLDRAAADATPKELKAWIGLIGQLQARLAAVNFPPPVTPAQFASDKALFEAVLEEAVGALDPPLEKGLQNDRNVISY